MYCADLSSFNEFWYWWKIRICLPMCLVYLALGNYFTREQTLKNSRERGSTYWKYMAFHSAIQERNWAEVRGQQQRLQNKGATGEWECCRRTRGACWRTRGATGEPWVLLEDNGWHCRMGVLLQNRGCCCKTEVPLQNGKCCYRMRVPLPEHGCLWQIW